MSHRRHERLSDKLPRPSCPTCGSEDPKVTVYDITGRCTDPFHQSDTESEERT